MIENLFYDHIHIVLEFLVVAEKYFVTRKTYFVGARMEFRIALGGEAKVEFNVDLERFVVGKIVRPRGALDKFHEKAWVLFGTLRQKGFETGIVEFSLQLLYSLLISLFQTVGIFRFCIKENTSLCQKTR
jgi:hypothetical protein